MPSYLVLVTREASASTSVVVEADTPGVAEDKALDEVTENAHLYTWALDDGSLGEIYICNPGNCAEEQGGSDA